MLKIGFDTNVQNLICATSTKGTSGELNYEPFETYGDTIIKFAATWLIYDQLRDDPNAGEFEISEY